MARLLLVLAVAALALVAGARADDDNNNNNHDNNNNNNGVGFCSGVIDQREALLGQINQAASLTPDQYADAKAAVLALDSQLQRCCPIARSHYCGLVASIQGPVCGFDFQTYQNPCDACLVGIYHAGACFGRNTNSPCYALPTIPEQVQCTAFAVQQITAGLHIYEQPFDAYLAAQVTHDCSGAYAQYRQSDGSCNNLGAVSLVPGFNFNLSYSGMAGEQFIHENRNLPADPIAYLSSGPNPRRISNKLFTQAPGTFQPNPVGGNGLTMAHVNFFVHDFMDHTNDDWQHPIAVPIDHDDPEYGRHTAFGQSIDWDSDEVVMLIPGTTPSNDDHSALTGGSGFPIRRNGATAWFDASQVYGTNTATTNSLRTFSGGLLRMGAGNLLPNNIHGVRFANNPFSAGDYRVNFHPGLTAMHTLWAREHNNIATMLNLVYQGSMTDEQLFQTARLIVCAEIIKIHSLEWTNQLAQVPSDQAVLLNLVSNFGKPQPPQNQYATHAVPEEFVAAYKWHSFVPPTLQLRDHTGAAVGTPVDYIAQFQDTTLVRTNGIEPILLGLATSPAGTIRFNNLAPGFQNIHHPYLVSQPVNPFSQGACVVVPGLDMATIDIVRDRERGINKYNDLRNLVGGGGIPLAQYFDDLADTPAQAAALADLYQWSINDVDGIVGIHGEHLYPGNGFPLTMAAMFTPFVLDRFLLDRFYTDNLDAAHYTLFGLGRLNSVTFSQVLCDNGITCSIPNPAAAFLVWDATKMNAAPNFTPTLVKLETGQSPF
jgi:hypothetical protein